MHGAEHLVVHKGVDDLLAFGCSGDGGDVLIGRQRILLPRVVVEADREVLTEAIVLEQQLELRTDGGGVDVVRAFPTQDMLSAFGQHTFKAKLIDQFGDVVGIDQLGVTEHLRFDAKERLDLLGVHPNLRLELFRVAD